MAQDRRNKLLKSGILFMMGGGLASIFNYLYQILMGRMLGPEKYAVLGSLFAILYFVQMSFGSITTVLSKYTSHLSATDKKQELTYLAKKTVKAMLIIGLGIFVFLIAIIPWIRMLLKTENILGIIIVAAIGSLGLIGSSVTGMINGLQRFLQQNIISATSALIKLSLAVTLVLLGFAVNGALSAILISTLFGITFGLFILRKTLFGKSEKKFNLKPIIKYFIPVFAANMIIGGMITIDQLLVKNMFSNIDTGYYIAAANLGRIIWFGSGFFISAMFPMITTNFARKKNTSKILKKALLYTSILSFSGVILYFAIPNQIVNILYGNKYHISYIIGFFGMSMAFYTLNIAFMNYNLAIHKYNFIFAMLIAILSQIFLILILHQTILEVVFACLAVNISLFAYFLITNYKALRSDHV